MRRLQEEMLAEAQAMVAERRGPEIAALRTEPGRDRVFAWAGGPPRAGQTALLAYNKACGALRQVLGIDSPFTHAYVCLCMQDRGWKKYLCSVEQRCGCLLRAS